MLGAAYTFQILNFPPNIISQTLLYRRSDTCKQPKGAFEGYLVALKRTQQKNQLHPDAPFRYELSKLQQNERVI